MMMAFFFGFDLTLRPHTYHGWIYNFFFRFIEWSEGTIVTGSVNRLYIVMVWLNLRRK